MLFFLFLGTATRLSICRGRSSRSNSRAYKYSLALHEPEIQAVDSPIGGSSSGGQNAIEEIDETQDQLADLEQVTQKGSEKTDSFFTK